MRCRVILTQFREVISTAGLLSTLTPIIPFPSFQSRQPMQALDHFRAIICSFTGQYETNRQKNASGTACRVEADPVMYVTRWESEDFKNQILSHSRYRTRAGVERTDLTVFGAQYFPMSRPRTPDVFPPIPGAPGSTWFQLGEGCAETFRKKSGHYVHSHPPVFYNAARSVQFLLPHQDNNG